MAFPGLGFAVIAMLSSHAASASPSLTDASMKDAIAYFGVLAGRDLSTDDAAWLKQQWSDDFEAAPQATAAQVDDMAFNSELHQRDQDPLALAQRRATALNNIYCTSAQTSDPAARRLREILTPDDTVLAADCLLGLVVTRFDVDGLVASHALLAAAAGQSHDARRDKAEVISVIRSGFAKAAPAEKAALANGELRHAVLARYWSRIEGRQEKRDFMELIRGKDLGDLRSPSRQLEDLALRQLGDIDYVAKVGDATLNASAFGTYGEWLETIAGYQFSSRNHDWMKQAIIDDFREDPEKVFDEIQNLGRMNNRYVMAETKFQRESGDTKRGLVDDWAVGLYCYANASSDPDERRLIELVFRHDPVIEADCQAGRVIRKRHQVIAEADSAQLLEQDLDISLRFASTILARPLLPEEEAIVRENSIWSFKKDRDAWQKENEQYRTALAEIEKHDTSIFLAMYKRKELFDPIYCGLQQSDDPFADDYLAMFRRNGAIVHEDCAKQVVTTRDEIDAFVGFSNFLALLNGRPPFDEAETEDIRQSVASLDLDRAEAAMLAVKEWWSLLNLDEKAAEAKGIRERGVTPEGNGSNVDFFVKRVMADVVGRNAKRRACTLEQVMQEGQVALFAARSGGLLMSQRGGELGVPGSNLENIVFSATLASQFCHGL